MRAILIVADSARVHPDGTFSILRGGIDQVHTPRNQPIQFRGSVLARISGDLSEAGDHTFQIRILNEEGQSIVPDISGGMNVPEGGGSGVAAMDFSLILPRPGRYAVSLLVDRQSLATWEVRAIETPAATQGGAL